eukprot:1730038-Rhodomonas_salina.1
MDKAVLAASASDTVHPCKLNDNGALQPTRRSMHCFFTSIISAIKACEDYFKGEGKMGKHILKKTVNSAVRLDYLVHTGNYAVFPPEKIVEFITFVMQGNVGNVAEQ